MATVFNSGFEARYFLSTDILAAAEGLVSTHLAPFNNARVAAATAFGFWARNLPFARTAQQYSLLYGVSVAWSATFLILPLAMRRLPIGSESATASTSPLSNARPNSPAGNTRQLIS